MSSARGRRAESAPRPLTRSVRQLGLAVALTGALSACVAPALDSGAFQRNAIHSLDSAVSDTRTSALALQNYLAARVPRPYADTVVTESEDAIGPVEDSFGAVDPPSPSDERLRDEVGALLSDAGDELAAARIALRRNDRAEMRQSVEALRHLAERMEQRSEGLS